eukprot:8442645-Ditylum_brightwellii.AAC.1
MVSTLPDEPCTVPPLREYFVGHSEERMDEIMHAVAEAKRTVIALVEEKSWDNQDENYDSSSCFDDFPASSHGGLCK